MVRLTRAQQQERTRAAVLVAAREEFGARGYADAKVDRIAERAELTRGAVYSNFPSKRALYLAVLLVDLAESSPESPESPESPGSPESPVSGLGEAVGAFARAWLERLPLTGDTPADGRLRTRSLAGVLDDERGRTALAQATRLEALLLALALESLAPHRTDRRLVRLAELVLTLLNGTGHLAETAPGFGDPFDVARACRHLTGLDLADIWDPPHLPYVTPARPAEDPWHPPAVPAANHLIGAPASLDADGVIAILGTDRLEAAEEAVRAARPGDRVTVAVVTNDPAELGRLVRLRVTDLTTCLRRVFPQDARPSLRLILDEDATVASAAGITDPDNATETAIRVRAGTVVARASGRGAAYAVATAGASATDVPARGRSEEVG
jgi:AcrR family transcriptional regulator